MSEYRGYDGKALDFLKKNKVRVGDTVKITTDLEQTATIMPRYEHSDDFHIVIKFKSGYNVGLRLEKIKKIEFLTNDAPVQTSGSSAKNNPSLPKILLLSTGGTIASRIDYRTGSVTPALTAQELNA